MPEMDGFEFLDEYRKLPKTITEYCKIAMLSSNKSNAVKRREPLFPLKNSFSR
ncbi:MAG: response regulator [Pedobacter sp.]|nr:MAG: response regulator [Pedobacter sp.]